MINTERDAGVQSKIQRRSSSELSTSACVSAQLLRAARAIHVFCTDEKHVRAENTVMVNTEYGAGVQSKIADRVRMRFSSAHDR